MKNYLLSIGIGMVAYVAIQAILMQIIMLDGRVEAGESVVGLFIPVVIALSFTFSTARCK